MVKNVFLQNGGQHNVLMYVSHPNCSRYLKKKEKKKSERPLLKVPCVKIWQHFANW